MAAVNIGYKVKDDQKLSYTITPSRNALMNAESVGRQITCLSRLLRALANHEDKERKWMVAITGIETKNNGSIKFDLLLAPELPSPTPQGARK